MKGIVIEVSGEVRALEMPDGDGSLQSMQQAVGGYIEHVATNEARFDIWCNEEGKLTGLPLNELATQFLYATDPNWVGHDVLVGPVLLTGGADNEGATQTVPDFLLEQFGLAS
jgi:hypothetical protein